MHSMLRRVRASSGTRRTGFVRALGFAGLLFGAFAHAPAFGQTAPTGVNDTANAFEDEIITIEVLNNDIDVEDGIVTKLNLGSPPAHGFVQKVLGCGSGGCDAIEYRPEAFWGGDFTFTYFPVDSDGQVGNETTVTVTVSRISPNQPPTATTNDYSTLSTIDSDSGGTVTLDVMGNDYDSDGDPLTMTAVTQPPGGAGVVTMLGNGQVTFRPTTNYRGTATFTYTIWDGITAEVGDPQPNHYGTATVFVEVQNRAPNPQSPTATTTVNTPVGFAAISQQPDPENDTVITGGLTQPANGSAVYDGTTGFIYTPNPGFVGEDTFTFWIEDIYQATAPSVATITVIEESTNSNPVAVDDTATTRSGPTAGEEVPIDVLANDSDADGNTLEVTVLSEPANGTYILSPSGLIRYTPNAGFTGTDQIDYQVFDGIFGATATVTITVNADNPPVAANDTAQVQAWASGQGPPSEVQIPVLANDGDPDADVLAYADIEIVQQPANGDVTQSCAGACNPPDYMPHSGFSGTDTFTYRAVDALGAQSNIATVTINVLLSGANSPPVANSDSAQTFVGEPVTIDVLANDTDPESQALTIVAVDTSGLGTTAIVGNQILFTPNGNTGTGTFGYTITDSFQPAAPATSFVVITVNPVDSSEPPTAVIAGGNRTIEDSNGVAGESVAFDGSQSVSNSGESITSYQWIVNGQVVAGATGPQANFALPDGANSVTLVVGDDQELSSPPATVTVTVLQSGIAPVAVIGVGSSTIPDSDGEPGENVPFQGSATDADGTVAQSTFRWTLNGQAVAAADGQANPTFALLNSTNAIGLSVTDNSGLTGSDTIIVTIGEASAIEELPGVEGNENLENTAEATDTTCSALLKADPATLTPDQVNLRATCETIYANVEENPEEVVAALETISSQQVTAQQSAAIDYTSAQLMNVAGRLTALRQGAKGISLAGLNIGTPGSGLPVGALASLGEMLFGEGGSSGEEEEGGLLDDKLGIFVNGSVRFGDKETTANETGFDFDTQGLTLGADYRFTDALVVGVALGYGNASADFVANGGKQDSDSYAGTVYGSWYGSRSYFDGIVSLGSVSYDSVRNINLFDGAIVDKALGSTDGTQWALGMATGFDFGKGGLRFGPNFAVNYIKADIDGFTEKTEGTSGLAMAFADQSADSLTIKAGGHFNYSLSRKWGIVSPQARFDIVRELANDSQAITIRYANDPLVTSPGQAGGSFVIFTDDPDEYYFLWGLGVAIQFMNGFSGFIDYESTESLDTINSAEVSFGLRYQTRFK